MKLAAWLGIVLIGTSSAFAEISAVKVTETFGKLTQTPTQLGKSELVGSGTTLGDKGGLETGKASLAEIEWADHTITRLGPATRFDYVASADEANLQSGAMLFSQPKEGKAWTIKTSTVTATITGATGFVEKEGNSVLLGVIEGKVLLRVGQDKTILPAGKMLVFVPGANPKIVAYDVPDFVRTSAFFHQFHQPLPNEKYVEKEIAQYNDLVARGFIEPLKVSHSLSSNQNLLATAGMAGHESAGTALYASNVAGSTVDRAGTAPAGSSVSNVNSYYGGDGGATLTVGNGGSLTYLGNIGSSGTTTVIGLTGIGKGANYYGGSPFNTGNSSLGLGNGTTIGTTANTYTGGTAINNGGATFTLGSGVSGGALTVGSSNSTFISSGTTISNNGVTGSLSAVHH